MTFEEKNKAYIDTCERMADKINPILDKLYRKISDTQEQMGEDMSEEYQREGCGNQKVAPVLTQKQRQEFEEINTDLVSQIEENPYEYPEIQPSDVLDNTGGKGGQGDARRRVRVKQCPYPKWMDELKGAISKSMFTRSKIRKGLDLEEALKNSIRKERQKGATYGNRLIVLLDTSGSMWQGGRLGNSEWTFLEALIAHLPHIASKYDGELWMADDCGYNESIPLQDIVDLKQLTSEKLRERENTFGIKGGGGSDFWGAYQMFDAELSKAKETDPNAEMTLVFMTDCGFDWEKHPELIPENYILMTTKSFFSSTVENAVFDSRGEKRKVIFMK